MDNINKFLGYIPNILSSKVSIYIYLFLFFYLVLFPVACQLIPALKSYMPKELVQLILGNYTNVVSALGASIAAGTGVKIHTTIKNHSQKNAELRKLVEDLHQKIDNLHKKQS
ncbi:MAG: hypothetical protein ACK5LP_05350 [Campylobacteraceae bacterium]